MGQLRVTPLLSILVAGLLAGCVSHTPRPTGHLFESGLTIMGHRGARGLAPENTLSSFEASAQLGFGFELDTQLSKDGHLVVYHDDHLGRTSPGDGPVHSHDLTYLQSLDAGSHFSPAYESERIPTLRAVLETYGAQVLVNIEVKSNAESDNQALAQALVETLHDLTLEEKVIVTSFNPFLLEEIRHLNPEIRRGQIYGTFKNADLGRIEKFVLRNLLLNKKAKPDLLMMEYKMATPRYVAKMQKKGYRVFVWTVNEEDDARAMKAAGVDGIITDYPDRLAQWLLTPESSTP